MGLVLVAEVAQGAQDRIGRRLPEAAVRRGGDVDGLPLQPVQVRGLAPADDDLLQHAQQDLEPHAAGHALAAGLVDAELREEPGHVHHAARVVHDDDASRAHHGPRGLEGVEGRGQVEMLLREAPARGAAQLDGLEVRVAAYAPADLEDDRPQVRPHGHFHETHVFYGPREGKDLRARAILHADGPEPGAPVEEDLGDVGEGLHVVEARGPAPEARFGGTGRLDARHAALSLDGVHERRRLAADEGPRPGVDVDVEIESRAQDVAAQEPLLAGPVDGRPQHPQRQGILGPDVDVALAGADGVAADDHPLQDGVGIRLHDAAVHEGAGVSLVAVADDVLRERRILARFLPLGARGEPRAAPAAQARELHLADDLLGRHGRQGLVQGEVAVVGDVLLDRLGVDVPPVAQHDEPLLRKEVDVLDPRDVRLDAGLAGGRQGGKLRLGDEAPERLREPLLREDLENLAARQEHDGGPLEAGDQAFRLHEADPVAIPEFVEALLQQGAHVDGLAEPAGPACAVGDLADGRDHPSSTRFCGFSSPCPMAYSVFGRPPRTWL